MEAVDCLITSPLIFPKPDSFGDEGLFASFSGHMVSTSGCSKNRLLMEDNARQFLHWWRQKFAGEECQLSVTGRWADQQGWWWDLREPFLRYSCPLDLPQQAEARNCLNGFMNFLDSLNGRRGNRAD
jgi:hypothetical protein